VRHFVEGRALTVWIAKETERRLRSKKMKRENSVATGFRV